MLILRKSENFDASETIGVFDDNTTMPQADRFVRNLNLAAETILELDNLDSLSPAQKVTLEHNKNFIERKTSEKPRSGNIRFSFISVPKISPKE